MRGCLVLGLACLLAAPAAATDALRLDRTDPDHVGAFFRPFNPLPTLPGRILHVEPRMVYRLPRDLAKMAVLDHQLTRLCQAGAFVQQSDGYYWAVAPGRSYGVAFSGGANLVDVQNRHKTGKVYFFDDQDGRCSVFVGDQVKLSGYYTGPLPGE